MKNKKKTVLFIFNSFDLGGVQKKLVDIAQYQKKSKKLKGIDIHFGFFSDREEDFPHNALLKGCKVTVHYFKPTNLYGKRRQLIPLFSWLNVARYIITIKPDVIVLFLHYLLLPLVVLKHSLFFIKTKLVISQDNIVSLENKKPFVFKPVPNWLISFLYNQADLIITQTKFAKNDLVKFFSINENKIKVIPNWIPDWKATSNKKIDILYSGRFSEQKNITTLLELLSKVISKRKTTQIALVGSGDKKTIQAIIHTLHEKKLTQNVTLLHPTLDMEFVMASSRILVLTSKFEGMPLVVLEAMATGVIPVVLEYPGVHEYIHNRETGFITSNIKKMEETILSILQKPSSYDALRKKMIKSVKKEFPKTLIEDTFSTLFK